MQLPATILIALATQLVAVTAFNASYAFSSEQQSQMLDEHNKLRALHVDTGALAWSETLAGYAQDYAANYDCSGILTHSKGQYGENLAIGYSLLGSVDAWYEEIKYYDYSAPGFSEKTGHFTQVVWKDSTEVGCAIKFCGNVWHDYIICEYNPAGNYIGEFGDKVMPLKSTIESSSSTSSTATSSSTSSSTSSTTSSASPSFVKISSTETSSIETSSTETSSIETSSVESSTITTVSSVQSSSESSNSVAQSTASDSKSNGIDSNEKEGVTSSASNTTATAAPSSAQTSSAETDSSIPYTNGTAVSSSIATSTQDSSVAIDADNKSTSSTPLTTVTVVNQETTTAVITHCSNNICTVVPDSEEPKVTAQHTTTTISEGEITTVKTVTNHITKTATIPCPSCTVSTMAPIYTTNNNTLLSNTTSMTPVSTGSSSINITTIHSQTTPVSQIVIQQQSTGAVITVAHSVSQFEGAAAHISNRWLSLPMLMAISGLFL